MRTITGGQQGLSIVVPGTVPVPKEGGLVWFVVTVVCQCVGIYSYEMLAVGGFDTDCCN